jgi:hypothetical protein
MRDYARAVGLDADEVVDEFCRLFAIGDRRASRVIKAQAELIGHRPEYADEVKMIPGGVDRRSAAAVVREQQREKRLRLVPRTVAVALDTLGTCLSAGALIGLTPLTFWPALGLTALIYYGTGTVLLGTTPGSRATELLRQHAPALFTVEDRAHA